MSLINQMLKDLDRRRDGGDAPAVPPAYRPVAKRRSPSPALAGLLIAILAMAGLVGWLAWERFAGGAGTEAVVAGVAPPAPTEEQAKPAVVPIVEPAPASAPEPQSAPEEPVTAVEPPPVRPEAPPQPVPAPTTSEPRVRVARPASEAAPASGSPPSRTADSDGDAEASGFVRKAPRPESPLQQAERHYREAHALLSAGRTEAGEARLRQALAASPRHDKAREMLALLLVRAGRYVEAGEILRAGLAIHPGNRQLARIYAEVLDRQQRLADAVALLERHRPREVAQDPAYYALLAAYYRRQARHDAAAAVYRRLVAVQPDNGVWWIGLGLSLEALGRMPAAQEAFRRARDSGSLNADLQAFVDARLAAEGAETEE